MVGPIGSRLSRSAACSALLSLVHGASLAVGAAVMWATMGSASLWILGAAGFIGFLMGTLLREPGEDRNRCWAGLLWGLLLTCWTAIAIGFGLLGLLALLGLLLTTPPVRAGWRRWRGRDADPGSGAPEAPGRRGVPSSSGGYVAVLSGPADLGSAARQLPDADVEDLCRLWRQSYFLLLDAGTPAGFTAVVDHRQHILDELDLRDPPGLRRWLDSGPRASGNPHPYLATTTGEDRDGPDLSSR